MMHDLKLKKSGFKNNNHAVITYEQINTGFSCYSSKCYAEAVATRKISKPCNDELLYCKNVKNVPLI